MRNFVIWSTLFVSLMLSATLLLQGPDSTDNVVQVPASHVRSLRSLLQSSPNFFSSTNSRSSSSNNNPAPNVFSWWPQGGLWSQARAASAPALPDIKTIQEVGLEEACVCWAPDECTCGVLQCPYVPPAGAAQADKAWSGLVPQLTLSAPMNQGIPAPRLSPSMLRRYNTRLSVQNVQPLYQLTKEHYLLEGARLLLAAGATAYKFRMEVDKDAVDGNGTRLQGINTVTDMARSPSLPYAALFDMPLTYYFMWIYPKTRKCSTCPYRETYDLASYLLQRYQGTGKQFFFGMWEGDNAMRKNYANGIFDPIEGFRVEQVLWLVQEKQRAVDDAKRDYGSCKEVYIWNYIEANLALFSVWNSSLITIANMLPMIQNPPVDYVSYSSWEAVTYPTAAKDVALENLTAVFDYLTQRLPAKRDVPGPRVFLGEFGFPMFFNDVWYMSPKQGRQHALYTTAVSIAWGSQWNLYWQLYDDKRTSNGTLRGYLVINEQGIEQPVWQGIKAYLAAADGFLSQFWACYGGWPSDYTYRAWAVKTLMKLIDNTAMPEPRVRDLYPAAPAPAVTVATAQQARLAFSQQTSARRDAAFNLNSAYGYEGPTGAALPDSRYPPKHQPLLPQPLQGPADRGKCPIPLPMLMPAPPAAPPSRKPSPGKKTG